MQINISIRDEEGVGISEYEFPSTDEGRAALASLRQRMSEEGLVFEKSEHKDTAIKVLGYGPIAFVNSFLEGMKKAQK